MNYHAKCFLSGIVLLFSLNITKAQNPGYEKLDNGVLIYFSNPAKNSVRAIQLKVVSSKIIEVIKSPELPLTEDTSLMVVKNSFIPKFMISEKEGKLTLKTSSLKAIVTLATGEIEFTDNNGKEILKENDSIKHFKPVSIDSGNSWQITQSFFSPPDEAFYGLGQHQEGVMNYKNSLVELLQNNSEVAIPFLVSSRNYGILWDNYAITKFGDGRQYESLDSLKLFNAEGKEGGLTANYVLQKVPSKMIVSRIESSIEHNYLPMENFPASFSLNGGKVIWQGYFQSPFNGLHKFSVRYGGYVKMWIDGKQVLDLWRQSWNPATAIVLEQLSAQKKYAIKIEWIPDGGESFISCNWLRPSTAEDDKRFILSSKAGDNVRYYFISGKNIDEVISGYRQLTGKAPIVPEWALGFWQSRERYKTQEQLMATVAEFRKRKIPLDNIVLDWQYWKPDQWGSQQFDTSRFPDARGMIDSLHHLYHTHIMISVWPKFYKGTENYDLLNSKGYLYTKNIEENNKDWLGYVSTFYDAFNPQAGKLFWKLVNDNLYAKGIDAFWMDASEPDIYSNLSVAHKKQLMFPNALGSAVKYFNAYPLVNAKVIYEGQRAANHDRRVFTLTRSAYAGSQRYAAAVWSGDIGSRWHDMKNQISAGVNFSMSGIPYWTMDIGGFAVEHRYEDAKGEDLKEWKELMTRWYQFGAFCPLFRSHGQYPYREIFNTASPEEPAYQAMLYYDKLRYRLLPYIYSLAAKTYFDNYTIMRGLVMDFPWDKNVVDINDEYLFGNSLLISPVYEFKALSRKVYLPSGTGWYDLYSGKYFKGGRTINADAPFNRMPVFVKEGSVIPFGPPLQYTSEKKADTISLFIYTGKDASFTLYEDDDTSYNYEKGKFATINFDYNELLKTLTLQQRKGSFSGMLQRRVFRIYWINKDKPSVIDRLRPFGKQVIYEGKEVVVHKN